MDLITLVQVESQGESQLGPQLESLVETLVETMVSRKAHMSSASRYYPRSPRYTFRPNEQRLMRFKAHDSRSDSTHAEVRNVSTTGLSFVVPAGGAPKVGDMLKVEFSLPGALSQEGNSMKRTLKNPLNNQVAWFAEVIRVESNLEWTPWQLDDMTNISQHFNRQVVTIVAIRFKNLPSGITKALTQSLQGKRLDDESADFDVSHVNQKELVLLSAFTALGLVSMILMAIPTHLWIATFRVLF